MTPWLARGLTLADGRRPSVMGILNVTPDSFSDGGRSRRLEDAIANATRLIAEGADLLDVGGESSRPGAEVVPVAEEVARVIPLLEALAGSTGIPISVDTTKPEVARRAIRAGAAVINDIRGLDDPEMAAVVADSDVGVVLMHMQGTPQTMQLDPSYLDVVAAVRDALARKLDRAERLGIERGRIAVDPGIGFGKTHEHNLSLLRNLGRFKGLGCALLIGTSRKGLLGRLAGGRPVDRRVFASVGSALAAAAMGADVLRVHDVEATVDAFRVWQAQHGW